jgi:type I restriction enzyme S subunit
MLDIIDYEGGSQPPKKNFVYEPRKGYVRLIQIRDFGDKPFPTYVPDSSRLKKVTKNDLLLARYGGSSGNDSLGRVCEGLDGAYNVALTKLIFPRSFLDKNYVKFLFMGPWFRAKVSQNSRSCQTGFNRSDVEEISFPVAPFNEQVRIAVRVKKFLDEVEESQNRLMRVQSILKRFRQSILAAACSGRLTADWRNDPTEGDELPNSWKRVGVGDVIEGLKYGTAQKCSREKHGVPVLRIPNIEKGVVDHSDLKYAKLPAKEFDNLRLQSGDVLLIRSNGSVSLVGKCALVRDEEKDFAYAGYLIRIRPNNTVINSEFLNLVFSSYDVRLQIELEARSTSGVNNINSDEVKALQITLPPIDEQEQVVRRVKELFAVADQIEYRYLKAKAYVDKLTPSVLAKAFRGELVEQDPNDEPASVLLEKIRASKKNGHEQLVA